MKDEQSEVWCVSFETHDGRFHPLRYGSSRGLLYGEKGAQTWPREDIEAMAKAYLEKNKDWLKSISDIYPQSHV